MMVTIGMPVFNDRDFLEESLKSILAQTYPHFKLLISDDGSTDGSGDICLRYQQDDPRIEYVRQPKNLGISANMSFLLNHANSTYFMWAADDDLWDKNYLETCVGLLEKNSDAIVSFSQFEIIDERGISFDTRSTPEYSNTSAYRRILNFAKQPEDTLGYGLFRRESIKEVTFPIWWWPNRKTPYNNIYPPICYFLAKGNYVEFPEKSLFFKRIKTTENTNHKTVGARNGVLVIVSYILRRFNLVTFSAREIRKANGVQLMLRTYPALFYYFFVKSTHQAISSAFIHFLKRKKLK